MNDIHDIKPLLSVRLPVSWDQIFLWTLAGVGVLALLLGAWFLWKRRKPRPVEAAVLSPEETARQRLAALSPDTPDGKGFYFDLSFIFREYLQGRFQVESLEMTTEELLPVLEQLGMDRALKQDIRRFILACDPVKFAAVPVVRAAMAADLAFVETFVEKTCPGLREESDHVSV